MSSCIFCRIVAKEIPAEIVLEDNGVVAFKDVQPQAPTHILVIPKKHVPRLADVAEDDLALVGAIHNAIQAISKRKGLGAGGFRVVLNNGPDAGQAVDHLHYHILAGRKLGWPPG